MKTSKAQGRLPAGLIELLHKTMHWVRYADFLQSQIAPFGAIPVFLAIGNHELVAPKSRGEYLAQFADWLLTPPIAGQRLKDNPKDHKLRTWYHWIRNGVDFITLDNASNDQFDSEQVAWLERVVARDTTDPAVVAIVAGMHAAVPPHTLGVPPPPHVCGGVQGPQSSSPPHPSATGPHVAPARAHVRGVHEALTPPPSSEPEPTPPSPRRLPGLVASNACVPPSSLPEIKPSKPPLLPHPTRVSAQAATAAQSQRGSLSTVLELCTGWIAEQPPTASGTRLGRVRSARSSARSALAPLRRKS